MLIVNINANWYVDTDHIIKCTQTMDFFSLKYFIYIIQFSFLPKCLILQYNLQSHQVHRQQV